MKAVSFPIRTLSTKITIVVCSVALVIAILISAFNYVHLRKVILDTTIEGLAGETRLLAQKFASNYHELKNDAFVIAQAPPILELVRAMDNNDVKAFDGLSSDQWRKRLEAVFASIMSSRPHYTQIRYIGVADGGRELVRTNRVGDHFEHVGIDQMQQKMDEPYFSGAQSVGRNGVYFSEITYNREYGQVQQSKIPTLRAAVPVLDGDGRFFGIIVINANYEKLLALAFQDSLPEKGAFSVNNAGDYLEYQKDGQLGRLEFHEDYTRTPPVIINKFKNLTVDEASHQDDDGVSYFVKLNVNPANPSAFLGIVLCVPSAELMTPAYVVLRNSLIFSLGLIVLSAIMAALFAHRLTKPLRAMTKTVRSANVTTALVGLPVALKDEIGDLARAFSQLANDLTESRAKANAVLETIVDGIITITEDGMIETCNPACYFVFGYRADEIIGKNIELLAPELEKAKLDECLSALCASGGRYATGVGHHIMGRRKDGSVFPMSLAIGEVNFLGKRLFTSVVRDITEQKNNEIERETLIEKLVRSNEELDEFAHIAAHDLKEPLRAIHNHSSFLIEDYEDKLDEAGKKRLHRVQYLTKRMGQLISDLFYFSRLGREEASIEYTDVGAIISDIELTMKDTLEENRVTLLRPLPLPSIYCDRVRATEMFRNLIVNAIKYNDKVSKTVEVGYHAETNVFHVKDNGIGIDHQYHDLIFKLFKRLNTSKQFSEGTGAGLTFVHKIVSQQGGTIWLESEADVGTTFFFTLAERKAA
ncbi:ATP-binding protein [Cohaesibacter celericrescens]|nr:ATP-binding protein [Cohaesibacter celericrescens]